MQERNYLAFFIVILIGVLLASCAPKVEYQEERWTRISYGFRRIIDEEARVVCWRLYDNGISCLPIDETALGR